MRIKGVSPKFLVSIVVRIFNLEGRNILTTNIIFDKKELPTLILQSKCDKVTTYGMLIEEYNLIAHNKLLKLKIFENGSHTRIYAEEEHREEYSNTT